MVGFEKQLTSVSQLIQVLGLARLCLHTAVELSALSAYCTTTPENFKACKLRGVLTSGRQVPPKSRRVKLRRNRAIKLRQLLPKL